jgi:hypothetical protein
MYILGGTIFVEKVAWSRLQGCQMAYFLKPKIPICFNVSLKAWKHLPQRENIWCLMSTASRGVETWIEPRQPGVLFQAGGCQMVYFKTKNRNLGTFWRVLQWKMLVYYVDIWSSSRPFDKFYGHLVNVVVILCIFARFGIFYQEKSGNPVSSSKCASKTLGNVFFQTTSSSAPYLIFFTQTTLLFRC